MTNIPLNLYLWQAFFSLLSACLASWFTIVIQEHLETKRYKRKQKRSILDDVMSNRLCLVDGAKTTTNTINFNSAMSKVVFTYSDNTDVIKYYKQFISIIKNQDKNETLYNLLKAMCEDKDVGIECKNLSEDLFKKVAKVSIPSQNYF